jgi:esterase/lipase superfamily enzyme
MSALLSNQSVAVAAIAATFLVLTGCASTPRPLMPTPTLYQEAPAHRLFEAVPPDRQRPWVKLFYITDRAKETDPKTGLPYGEERARALAYGDTAVELVPALDWPDLVRLSGVAERSPKVTLRMGPIQERGRFPSEPYAMERTADGLRRAQSVMVAHEQSKQGFQAVLQGYLASARKREVMLFVHGFNETFATAAYTAADLCHFFGREQACAFFTWPATASGNPLFGYTNTSESAEFAIGHLVKAIRLIADTPGVERLQLLAHSRGTALLLSALRELAIQSIAAGYEPAERLKIDNVVLMSPDIDTDVAREKLIAFSSDPDLISRWSEPRLPKAINGRLTIYSSPTDRALLLSKLLFKSEDRLGRLRPEDLGPASRDYLVQWGNIDLVVYEGKRTDFFDHSYFLSNPEVSSDLVQLIRFGRAPGEPGRPLEPMGPGVWRFPQRDASAKEPSSGL